MLKHPGPWQPSFIRLVQSLADARHETNVCHYLVVSLVFYVIAGCPHLVCQL